MLGSLYSVSQNSMGALNSNFTPTNGVYINPSSMLDAEVWLDINIVGVGAYANNDLVYLKDNSWISLLRDLSKVSRGEKDDSELPSEDDIGYNQGRNFYHAYNRTFVAAPSAVWSQGDFAAGLAFTGRSYTAVRRVPSYVAQFIENGVTNYTQQHDIDYSVENLRVASLNFAEIKGSFAYTFLKRRRDMFMGGVSLSKFFSIGAAGANISRFDFLVDNDSLANVVSLQSDLMYTSNPRFNPKGGMGIDFGFTYQKMLGEAASYYPNSPKIGCRSVPYKYKLGVSIMDIGAVKFDEDDQQYRAYDFEQYSWLNYADDDVDEDAPLDLFAAQQTSEAEGEVRKPNKVRLPTFASVQFDYNLWASRIYVNGTIIQGIPVGKKQFGLRHANSLSVTPRYESYWFDVALPLSLYEYQHPQLGLSLRLGPLTIGSDKLISWIKRSDLYGADVYAYLKVPIRYHPKCKSRYGGAKAIKAQNGQKYKKYHPCDAYN